ncbi:PRC and DUF2382 domain-containing protein [Corynebacterium sp. YIM 101645]|uniref:PRC and DUF2382 domain-containing protein n=1 Tax=Corynebacterium lemuris TaxID=1859292 RepID=A0ABT2FXT5_9CORY|nr:PRC and DUF2382 domain-containing protein [Corynebacterium lemuris]MCS5479981.1 PRC and DUF2382 domain-containing protein [Corynebacterium lemuris]
MVNRNIQDLTHATAYDKNGDKLGSVKQVYINDATGQPDFVEVGHGLFGMSSSLVPLRGHQLTGEELRLSFTKDRIQDAPGINDDAHLTDEDQSVIYRHYGLEGTDNVENYDADLRDYDRDRLAGREAAGFAGGTDVTPDVTTDRRDDVDADSSLTLSEERVNVDKERVQTGAVRLRKYVVHDTETVEVPVEREEVRIERTPVDGDRAVRGGDLGEDEASVTLSEERVNVTKETVPVEEVSLHKETVRDTETVREDVAREELDVDGAVDGDVEGDPTLRR